MALQIKDPILLTFIHNKRAAGTSISKWLMNNFEGQRIVGKHINFYKTQKEIGDLGFTFGVVRNPWDRCVSAFFYQKRKIEERTNKIAKGKTRKYKPQEIEATRKAFDYEFSDWLIQNQEWTYLMNSQWESIEGVDLILNFESLQEDFVKIQEKLNCYNDLFHANKSSREDYRQYYNNETKNLVARCCKTDIEMFNYEF